MKALINVEINVNERIIDNFKTVIIISSDVSVIWIIIPYAPGGGVSLQLVMFEMVYECL